MADYDAQQRGGEGAYDRYLAAMDASMRQKVAVTAAFLLGQGRVADMGMGSGAGSHALAALYPGLEVLGVDVSPALVELARAKYSLPNLSFLVGDIAQRVVPPETLDGILNSSVFHHVTSFGGYEAENVTAALRAQVEELRAHGVLLVRDFLSPGPGDVWLDLPSGDGDASDDPRRCSTAALFERFAGEFRSLSAQPGFSYVRGPPPKPDWQSYRVSLRLATEFLLRKDYRQDWEAEAKEEYTYFTQARFEEVFAQLGLRVLASTPVCNPWILRHRYEGRAAVRDLEGHALPFPPTNFVIAGEKAPAGEGVRFRCAGAQLPRGYLQLETHWNRETGQLFDLAWRPNRTLDVLPWFERGGSTFVLVRASYPRPVLCIAEDGLEGARAPHYVTEPLNILQTDRPLGQTVEAMLQVDASLPPGSLRRFSEGATYYPSPGGTQEEVRSVLVEIEPHFAQEPLLNRSGFSTSGHVRALEVQQLLRAAQVGALPDARLELNTYELLLQTGKDVGPWIGEEISLERSWTPAKVSSLPLLLGLPPRRVYEAAPPGSTAGFLKLCCADFEELDASGGVVAAQRLEYVLPAHHAARTVAVALLARRGLEPLMAVTRVDLPAAQAFRGNSDLLVAPAWRLPQGLGDWLSATAWLRGQLREQHGVNAGELRELGGAYRPSPGLSPELVHPVAFLVGDADPGGREGLEWVPLRECIPSRSSIVEGHLRILALRAAHALGCLTVRG